MSDDNVNDAGDSVNDLMADAAVVHDSDLRSPAVTAALMAAMEALIHMPERSDQPLDAPAPAVDEPYVSPARTGRPRARRALASAAAVVLLAIGAVGIAKLGGDDAPADRATATEGEPGEGSGVPEYPNCPPVGDSGPVEVPPGAEDPAIAGRLGESRDALEGPDPTAIADCEMDAPPDPGTEPPPYPAPTLPPDESAAPPPDAPFADRVEFALRLAYLDNVARIVATSDTEVREVTADEQTGSMRVVQSDRVAGSDETQPFADTGPTGFEGSEPTGERSVNHCRSQYFDYESYNPRSTGFAGVAADLRSGTIVEDGHETIDGRDTIRLRNLNTGDTTWLDAETLRPVRAAFGDEVTTFEFLPRTDENLDRLVPSTEGLTLVDQDPGAEHCLPAD